VNGSRPAWTLTEAVERTGASRSTIRRYRDAGKFPNAYKDTAGAWRFPLEDLLAVGLKPTEPAREQAQNTSTEQATTEQLNKLEQALIMERTRADNAERLAASYLANVQDLRRALVMLEAGAAKPEPATEPVQNTPSEQPVNNHERPIVSEPESAPLRLWRRLSGARR
jgi:predicted DNA-binding transcriptional regulator AlpA